MGLKTAINWFLGKTPESIEEQRKKVFMEEKEAATTRKEPWVRIISSGAMTSEGVEIEADWNIYFVNELIEKGYSGKNQDEIVEAWFRDLCRGVIKDFEAPQ